MYLVPLLFVPSSTGLQKHGGLPSGMMKLAVTPAREINCEALKLKQQISPHLPAQISSWERNRFPFPSSHCWLCLFLSFVPKLSPNEYRGLEWKVVVFQETERIMRVGAFEGGCVDEVVPELPWRILGCEMNKAWSTDKTHLMGLRAFLAEKLEL